MLDVIEAARRSMRRIGRHLGASTLVVITLGAAAGPVTVAMGLLRRPTLAAAGVTDPKGLLRILGEQGRAPGTRVSRTLLAYPEFVDLRRAMTTLIGLATSTRFTTVITTPDVQRRVSAALVSAGYFRLLGVSPEIGRLIEGGQNGGDAADPVAVISHDLWKSAFNSQRDVVGRHARVGGVIVTIIGVAPKEFSGIDPGSDLDLWMPVGLEPLMTADLPPIDEWAAHSFNVVGRPKAGFGLPQVRDQLGIVTRNLRLVHPNEMAGRSLIVEPLTTETPSATSAAARALRSAMWLLAAVIVAVACFNIAGVLMVRTISEEHNAAVRMALGAGYQGLVAGAIMEIVILAVVGIACGLVWGGWTLAFIRSQSDGTIRTSLDPVALGLVALAVIPITLSVVALPALHWRHLDVPRVLTSAGRSERRRSRDSREALVATQIALSVVVALAAIELGRTIQNLRRVNPGFDTTGLLSVSFVLSRATVPVYSTQLSELPDLVEVVPGVDAAAVGMLPLLYNAGQVSDEVAVSAKAPRSVPTDIVGPGYFRTLGIAVLAGREFEPQDAADSNRLVIVNQSFAHEFWPAQTAVGQSMEIIRRTGKEVPATVVGVVQDFMTDYVADGVGPRFFQCALQHNGLPQLLYVRVSHRLKDTRDVRRAIASLSSIAPFSPTVSPVDAIRERSMAFVKNTFLAAGVLTALALTMATVGVFSMQRYNVAYRAREFGIRLALGSPRRAILGLVMRSAARAVLAGVLLATPLVFFVSHSLRLLTYGTGVLDPLVLASTGVLLGIVVLIASVSPVLTALRVDPMESIRAE